MIPVIQWEFNVNKNKSNPNVVHVVQQNAMSLPQEGTQFVTIGKNDVILLKTFTIAFMYLRLYWRFLFIPVTLDWQVKSLSICSCNRDWLTTHRRSAKYPPSLWLSWRQFTWLSINAGIILVQQWVGLKLSQWTAYTCEVRQLMVCVISISTFSRTQASFLSTRSCKVYTWIVFQTLTQIISVQKKLWLTA